MAPTHRIGALAREIVDRASASGVMLAIAESCTGGMVAAAITDIPGASAVLDRGFITYSNEAKTEMLGVPARLIASCGAVSQPVAKAMAAGALQASRADYAVSITGIAGPAGDSPDKPIGLVWFGLAAGDGAIRAERRLFTSGDRAFVRLKAVQAALAMILSALR